MIVELHERSFKRNRKGLDEDEAGEKIVVEVMIS